MEKGIIRKATRDDLSRMAEIFVFNNRINFYPIFKEEEFSFSELQVVSLANEYFGKEENLREIYVYDDGIIRGFIQVKGQEIHKLYVDSFFQGRGIGDKLINYALQEFDVNWLWVLEKNIKGQKFYHRYGFEATGRKVFEEGTTEYLLELRRDCKVETGRLTIRPIFDEEIKQMIAKEPDEEMKIAYGEMLEGCLQHPEQRLWYTVWNVELKDKTVVGDLCFKGLAEDGVVEIGYGIKEEFQKRGIATEAVIAMSQWAKRQPGVNLVEAETDPDNVASQKVLAKAGYVANGVMGEEGPRFVLVK